MKKILLALFLVFAISMVSEAQSLNTSTIGLNGYYDITNWDQIPNSGTIDVTGAPNSLVFNSGDSGGGPDTTYITIAAANHIIVKINWTYETFDIQGSRWDYPVYIIDGVMHQFSSFNKHGSEIPGTQSGLETFVVEEGQAFGFGAYTVDGILGKCTINSVSFEFKTVPIGISAILGAFGLIGISFFAKRRLKKSKINA